MRYFCFFSVAVLLAVGFFGCSRKSHAASSALDRTFSAALKKYTEYALPNSMARTPGVSLDQHLKKVHADFTQMAASFDSETGVHYLARIAKTQKDDVASCCAIQILADTRRSDAKDVLMGFAKDSRPTIAEHAEQAIQDWDQRRSKDTIVNY